VSSHLPSGSFSNRTLGLDPMLDAHGILDGLSLLIINNNPRWQAIPRDSANHPAGWLRLFEQPAMRLRMLLLDPMNAGYYCGEFLSLSSALNLTALFPWVLCLSGPDSRPTPYGLFRLSTMLSVVAVSESSSGDDREWAANERALHLRVQPLPGCFTRSQHARAWLFADTIIPNGHHLSMDLLLFFPSRMYLANSSRSIWEQMAEQCIRSPTGRLPETALFDACRHEASQLGAVLGMGHTFSCTGFSYPCIDWHKAWATAPEGHHVHWHSHNHSAVDGWLTGQERMRSGIVPWSHQNNMVLTKPLHPSECQAFPKLRSSSACQSWREKLGSSLV